MANTTKTKTAKARAAKKQGTTEQGRRIAQGQAGGRRPAAPARRRARARTIRSAPSTATSKLILTQAMPHLGQAGDLVKVRPGFARNYLVPQGLATFATQTTCGWSRSTASGSRSWKRPAAPTCRTWRPDRPALADDRGQRQRRGASLRLGQRRSDRRRARRRRLPDRGRDGPDRRAAQGTGPLLDQDPPGQDIDSEVKLWVVPTHTDEAAPPV